MNDSTPSDDHIHAPLERAAKVLTEPFRDFVAAQSASGWVLLGAMVLAIALANSPWADRYFDLLHLEVGVTVGDAELRMSFAHWVNDGLMAVFFFLLGLELKRELLVGQLNDLRNASSVLCAAVGGMAVPALLFLVIADDPTIRDAWAIPMATDTAFALMLLVLLGKHVPAAARAFLVGLAIVDDLGAILVIALGYTPAFEAALLLPAALGLVALAGLNAVGVRNGLVYAITGSALWITFMEAGLHGTLAGVAVALAAPVRPAIPRKRFVDIVVANLRRFVAREAKRPQQGSGGILEEPKQQAIAEDLTRIARKATAPLARWEARLEKPVSFIVMPTFAFMNSGIVLSVGAITAAWTSELSYSILLGLLVGKPLGILVGVWIGALLGVATLPAALSWRHALGLGLLGSIGFTMSLFIATLSFGADTALLDIAKQSIVVTSLCGGLAGFAWLRWASGSKSAS